MHSHALPGWPGAAYSRYLLPLVIIALFAALLGSGTVQRAHALPSCPATCYVATTGNDITGDGSQANPFRTIQHAINDAGPGGTVIVAAGTYNESVRVTYPITLEGAGAGQDARTYSGPKTIINSQGAGPYGDGIDVSLASNGLIIDGFQFEGNAAGVAVSSSHGAWSVINCVFFNNAQGIYIDGGSDDVLVQHNVFYWNRNATYDNPAETWDDRGYGIYVNGSLNDSLIDGNTFTGNSVAGIAFTGSSYTADTTISNNTSTGDASFAILNNFHSEQDAGQCGEEYAPDTLICYNTVLQAGGDAIVVGYHSSDFDIAGNTISRGDGAAIAFTGQYSGDVEVYDNLLSANQYGINLLGGYFVYIVGNQIVSNRTAGINVATSFSRLLEINHNAFASNRAGLVNQAGVENGFDATCNWWNSQNGPRIASNPGAWGDTIVGLDRSDFQPWLTTSDLDSNCDDASPEVTITAPTETNYAVRQRVTPAFTCTDADSGIASCKAYVNTGSSYDESTAKAGYYFSTNTAGTFTYTVIAIDHAGNTSQESVTYTVGNQP